MSSSQLPQITEIDYLPDSRLAFDAIRDMPSAVLLDSGGNSRGRYDIIAAAPLEQLQLSPDNPEAYRAAIETLRSTFKQYCPELISELPFCGGLIGYLSYTLGEKKFGLHDKPGQPPSMLPLLTVGIYPWAIISDHQTRRSLIAALPSFPATELAQIKARLNATRTEQKYGRFRLSDRFRSNLDFADYKALFDRVQDYIQAGDCYQINLSRRFSARFDGDPWQAYQLLSDVARAPYSAYLEFGDNPILCLSPERFIRCEGRRVNTAPIKGTASRMKGKADRRQAESLYRSEKNRAENLMIVDLLRNDLGQVCKPGSIHVDKLFELQSFATVHHLVSEISGELRPEFDALDVLSACFPGGSITGAPKKRAMEIIQELEPDHREIFCGSIFLLSANGRLDSNIAIRSLLCHEKQIHCWAGGGLVADSEADAEFEETWSKVGKLLDALSG